MLDLTTRTLDRCPSCYCGTGYAHSLFCEIQQCPLCGHVLQNCSCDGLVAFQYGPTKWTGEWPGTAEAREAGYFCTYNSATESYVRCCPTDDGAMPDAARVRDEGVWNIDDQKFYLPSY